MKNFNQHVFYHIYPLGLCNAPSKNYNHNSISYRLDYLYKWIAHIKNLGVTVVYIGPLFESISHGYDTSDYYHIDKRLGDRQSFAKLVQAFHNVGIKVIVDGVFNHVGRNFWAFKDVLKNNQYSWYCDWFQDLKFGKRSPLGDPFIYKTWKKHYSLVKLNLRNKYVKEHLFKAVEMWINELGIDGLRLDAADCLKIAFIRDLKKFCKKINPDFLLLGEIVHGDYRKKVNEKALDAVTNYQCYEELFSAFNNNDFKALIGSFNREFGSSGLYKNISLYNFIDNHDVNRASSKLKKQEHLYPLHVLLFTMFGSPSIYYGSEFGIDGKRNKYSDSALRPFLNLDDLYKKAKNKDLIRTISNLTKIRKSSEALCYGEYKELLVNNQQFVFSRITKNEYIIVIINSSENDINLDFFVPEVKNAYLVDLLNIGDKFIIFDHRAKINPVWKNWARILKVVF
ncbi:MAG: alpha-amylase family glycosyl hydrolase [Candidatus Sericytochromatia bacterium]